ncbi:MAG TPA: DUF2141 domain-containing protein [Gallionella sp.]|nr:DUF2141 domain-containing protein [Gallionella sp.]
MKHIAILAALLMPPGSHAGELKLVFQGADFSGKALFVAVHSSAADFPASDDKTIRSMITATGTSTELLIHDIPAGEYAVAVFVDMNGNGKLDRNFIGIPGEPTGTSRDAQGRFGPPKFKDAAFKVGEGVTSQTIHIR